MEWKLVWDLFFCMDAHASWLVCIFACLFISWLIIWFINSKDYHYCTLKMSILLKSPLPYVHQHVATNGASSGLIDDSSHAPVISIISGNVDLHTQFTKHRFQGQFISPKVHHSSNILEIVNDVSVIQWLWYGGKTVCSFIASDASMTWHVLDNG